MGRPNVPLIERDVVVARALDLIDRKGVDALTIRALAGSLGVNGGALYYHFRDKEEIVEGVRALVLREAHVHPRHSASATWRDYVVRSATRYRAALLKHPNAAPIMTPTASRAADLRPHDYVIAKMVDDGVPIELCLPIIDSIHLLAFGSAVTNPLGLTPAWHIESIAPEETRFAAAALRSAPASADKMFALQLQVLIEGWQARMARVRGAGRRTNANPAGLAERRTGKRVTVSSQTDGGSS